MDRRMQVLLAVVDEYIATGEPVGSKALVQRLGNSFCSATIRNDMAQLCEAGYLMQPHTSAGRIPTVLGYRAYVDAITARQPASFDRKRVDEAVNGLPVRGGLAQGAAEALSELTGYPSVCTESDGGETLAAVSAVPIAAQAVTVVTVARSGRVRSATVRCPAAADPELIGRFCAAANAVLCGLPAGSIGPAVFQRLAVDLGDVFFEAAPLIEALQNTVAELAGGELALSGEKHLFGAPDYNGDRLREMLQILSDRPLLLRLFTHGAGGLRVLIGSENPLPQLSDSALLVTGFPAGRLGVIAPVRTDYRNIIPELEYFAKAIEKRMEDHNG